MGIRSHDAWRATLAIPLWHYQTYIRESWAWLSGKMTGTSRAGQETQNESREPGAGTWPDSNAPDPHG